MYDIQPALPAEVVTNVLALDAVFVCLFLFHRYGKDRKSFSQFFGAGKVVRWEDCGSGAFSDDLFRDMILLENQLPLYILIDVFKMLRLPSYIIISAFLMDMYMVILEAAHGLEDLKNAVRKCFAHDNDAGDLVLNETSPRNHHLLHYLLKLVRCAPPATGDDSDGSSKYQEESGSGEATLSPATLLHRHVIHFNNGSSGGTGIWHLPNWPRFLGWASSRSVTEGPVFIHQMRFDPATSLLLLPALSLHDYTEVVIRNLLACEQKYRMPEDGVTPFTSYVLLMDDLIDREEDVELLTGFKVISYNGMGSNLEACQMWNRLGTNLDTWQSAFFVELIQEVNTPRNNWVHRWWAEFKKSYFSRPWYTVPVIAGFVILVLTLLQTIFSILSYN